MRPIIRGNQYAVDQAGVDGLVLKASKDMCVSFEQVQQYSREPKPVSARLRR